MSYVREYFYYMLHPRSFRELLDAYDDLEEEADQLYRLGVLHYNLRRQAESALAVERSRNKRS